MANIIFNNKNYSVDNSFLSSHLAELKSHLSTVMSGSGATIKLDGTTYNIDSTKLSTAKNDFVSHLGTIAGSGHKVIVGGVEYGIDSGKVAGAVSEIEAVLGGAISGGGGESGGFPIAWNTREVEKNTIVYWEEEPIYVKISDYVPSKEEILNTTFKDGVNGVYHISETQEITENCFLVRYAQYCFAVLVSEPGIHEGLEFSEAGLYFDCLGFGEDWQYDCVIEYYEGIAFTINGDGYCADTTMTWDEWFTSHGGRVEFEDSYLYRNENVYMKEGSSRILRYGNGDDTCIAPSDTIIPRHAYFAY